MGVRYQIALPHVTQQMGQNIDIFFFNYSIIFIKKFGKLFKCCIEVSKTHSGIIIARALLLIKSNR
jgi:hypothetical protein